MTDTLTTGARRPGPPARDRRDSDQGSRPGGRAPGASRASPSPPLSPRRPRAAVAFLTSALGDVVVGLVAVQAIVAIAWASEQRSGSGAGAAIRVGCSVWLSALHTRIHVGAAVLGVPPLGLTLLLAWLVARSSDRLARDHAVWRDHRAALVAARAVAFAVLAAVVATLADTPSLHPSPATAAVGGAAVGALGAGWGLARRERRTGALGASLPPAVRLAVSSGLLALGTLLIAATVLSGVMLAAHHSLAAALNQALSPGPVGTGALVILQLLLSPVLVVGALSWLAGPGFAVGAGTSVSPYGTSLGAVPALPLLAALPSGASPLGGLVLVLPIGAGALAGLVLLRRSAAVSWATVATVGAAALVAGSLACAVCYAAGGPAGAGRLLTVGPSGWRVGLALAVEVAVGGLLVIAGRWLLLRFRRGPVAPAQVE